MTQLKRLQAAISKSEFDAAVISSEINCRYLSDFAFSDGFLLISPHKAYLITDFRYAEAAKNAVTAFEIAVPECTSADCVIELIKSEKYKRIAIEEDTLSCSQHLAWAEKLSEAELVHGCSRLLREQRKIKLPYETERIKKAQSITDAAFAHILPMLSTNITEQDVALELEFFMRRNGAEATAFDTIAVSGPSSALPHGTPSNCKLRQGFLTMDFGAKYNGYCSDMTRTVVIGKAEADVKKLYQTVLDAQKAALEGIHGGMLCKDADRLARSYLRRAGYDKEFGHSLGHGVGMFIHEAPNLSQRAKEDSRLEAGNVVTVEPGIYIEGKYGCRIEDMIAINPDGSIYNFTQSPKELIEIV